jgi:hypothetical protein
MDGHRGVRRSAVVNIHAYKDARPIEAEFRSRCFVVGKSKVEGSEPALWHVDPPLALAPIDNARRMLPVQHRPRCRVADLRDHGT